MPQKPKALDHTESARAWWGVELRNWRRTRSLSSVALGTKVELSGTMVERIEKNQRSCTAELAQRFDTALDAGGALVRLWEQVEKEADSLVHADKPPPPSPHPGSPTPSTGTLTGDTNDGSEPPVIRRRFLALGSLAAAPHTAHADIDLPTAGTTPLPKSIRPQDIDQIRTASTTLAQWDNLYGGGGPVREAFIGHLHWAHDLLTLPCPTQLRADLHTAVGQLAIAMGASAFDAYDHPTATHLLDFGTRCAEQAGNWHLRAVALNWRARQAIWCGTPDTGLTHAEQGLVRSDRLTPREQAMLHNARARAYAKMGHRQEALTAIGTSDDTFTLARAGEDGPWMAYYDHAQHHGDTGHALYDIALKDPRTTRTAATRLHTAVQHHTDHYLRSRALSGTKLATLLMTTGDPQHATTIANRALDEAGRIRSRRAIDDIRALGRSTHPYRHHPDTAELRHRITTLITT
ncbi:helix-turn-helix transcriptional regulator [Streptomyces sp. NPDC005953]|uniref:helix-turn-helix transcriptional regulator n=1 Tax=Streptomyces sp. NPDC005953 TaxID=3156719 RepID=UPI0033EFD17F